MARTRARNPECPMVTARPFRRHVETRWPRVPATTHPLPGNPSENSVQLLFSLPHFVFAEIFALALAESLFQQAHETPFFAYVPLIHLITQSKELRSVCQSWTQHLRSSLFAGRSARSGLFALVNVTDLPQIREVFPMLSHCAVDLGDMMNLPEMEQRLVELRSHASLLKTVRAVTWDNYSFQHMNMANYGSARTVRSRTRIMQEYLDYPLLVEVQEALTKRATGRDRLSNLELRDLLFSELRDLHHYHAHLLRNILSCVPSATHLTIPAFIMPILLGEWPYPPTKSSAIQSELGAIRDEGKSISDIIKESQHVQFVGLPNAFILPWGEDAGAEQHDVQRRMGIEIYRRLTEDNFSKEFFWPSRRLGLHGVLDPINPDCKAEWWLRFLESAISSGRLSNLHIAVGATKASLPIGPPSLGLRPTRDYFTQPAHLHFCKEFSNLNLRGITYLELKLLTICPAFFTNVKKNHVGINGVWKITSAPQLCSHWVNLQRNAPDQLAGDLAVIDKIMDDGRIPDGNLDIEISLAYDTARLPVGSSRTLELYPLKGKIIYKCCPVKQHGLPVEYPRRVDFTTETFSSELRGLHERRKEDGFGLFNLLDELAGVDLKRIKGGIQSYLAR